MKCFYFGVWKAGEAGHFLYNEHGSSTHRHERELPFAYHILDSHLLVRPDDGKIVEGKLHIAVINGWTIVGFWDCTGDSRPASNSSFIVEGVHDVFTVLAIARERFPSIWARVKKFFPAEYGRQPSKES